MIDFLLLTFLFVWMKIVLMFHSLLIVKFEVNNVTIVRKMMHIVNRAKKKDTYHESNI